MYAAHVPALVLCCGICLLVQAQPRQDDFKISAQEQKLLDLTNLERKKKDLPPLKPSPLLLKVARAHSANMAKQGKMAHILDGKKPNERVLEAGYDYNYTGENIAEFDRDYSLKELMKDWMDSQHHRENILNKKFTEIGVGIARGKKGLVYYTQVFGKPLRPRR
jgi:uncharacterized protein YkwD